MPHLVFHMSVARELAETLRYPILEDNRGAFYMGSTGPDMHILEGRRRSSSHFFELDEMHEQNSVETFFEAHPELRKARELSGGAPAFVAGYLTHLVIDEIWITEIYRPFFGPASPLGGNARANVMDRVLQYDMDLQRRRQTEIAREIRRVLLERPPTWERFRYLAGRFLLSAGIDTEEKLEEFLETVPDLLKEAKEHVTEGKMTESYEKMTSLCLETLRGYLA
jgi:hypothetical protein